MLGGTERSQISEKRRVVAWTSGRCDASACGRVSRVSESMQSSESSEVRMAEWHRQGSAPRREEGREQREERREKREERK